MSKTNAFNKREGVFQTVSTNSAITINTVERHVTKVELIKHYLEGKGAEDLCSVSCKSVMNPKLQSHPGVTGIKFQSIWGGRRNESKMRSHKRLQLWGFFCIKKNAKADGKVSEWWLRECFLLFVISHASLCLKHCNENISIVTLLPSDKDRKYLCRNNIITHFKQI